MLAVPLHSLHFALAVFTNFIVFLPSRRWNSVGAAV
jgi:hypothetical protein